MGHNGIWYSLPAIWYWVDPKIGYVIEKLMVILQEFGWYTEKAFGFSPKWLVSRYIPVARASNPDTRPRHLRASRSHPRDLNVPLPSRLAIDAHSHCTHSDIWHYNFLAVDIRQQDPDRNNVEKCSNDELWRDGPEGSSPTVVCSGNPRGWRVIWLVVSCCFSCSTNYGMFITIINHY